MNLNFNKLPRKSMLNKKALDAILDNAEDKLYEILFIDYKCGLIKFENIFTDAKISIFSTTLTVVRQIGDQQFYNKGLTLTEIKQLFNNNAKIIK